MEGRSTSYLVHKKTLSVAKRLGKRIRAFREDAGLSQEDFAVACGFGRSYYWRLEQGRINATLDTLVRIADRLKLNIRDLFE